MFLMPVSGYIHVRAGGLGVTLGECQLLSSAAKWTHIAGSHALLLAPASHVGVVLCHHGSRRMALCSACCPAAASTGTYST
jgi:hypothetical protein